MLTADTDKLRIARFCVLFARVSCYNWSIFDEDIDHSIFDEDVEQNMICPCFDSQCIDMLQMFT